MDGVKILYGNLRVKEGFKMKQNKCPYLQTKYFENMIMVLCEITNCETYCDWENYSECHLFCENRKQFYQY